MKTTRMCESIGRRNSKTVFTERFLNSRRIRGAERDWKKEMPKINCYGPSNYIKQGGVRFNREEEYEAYRKAQVTEVKVQQAAKKMTYEMMSHHHMSFMCGMPFMFG